MDKNKESSYKKNLSNHKNPTTLDYAPLRPEFARPSGSGRIFRMPKIENSLNSKDTLDFTSLHPEFSIFVHKKFFIWKNFLLYPFCILLISLPVFADGWDASKPSHATLYADTLTSRTSASPVSIADSQGLFVTGDITTLGNIGIGTASPGGKLDVVPNVGELLRVSSDTAGPYSLVGENGQDMVFLQWRKAQNIGWLQTSIGGVGTGSLVLQGEGGNVGIGTANPITTWGKGLDVNGNIHIHMAPSDAGLLFGDNDPVNTKWHIGYWEPSIMPPNGGLVFTESNVADYILTLRAGGNVGIGTASPTGRLHVLGPPWSGSYIPQLTVEAPTHINSIFDRTDTQDHMTLTVGSVGTGIHFGDTNRFFISADPYTERNTGGFGKEIFTILPNGNVGIGTTGPEGMLHLAKNVAAGDPYLFLERTGINPRKFRLSIEGPSTSPLRLNLADMTAGVDRFVITDTGNVGIGTTGPETKLDVRGDFRTWLDGEGDLQVTHLSHTSFLRSTDVDPSADLALGANNTEWLRIKHNGNVGIGTASPVGKMEVVSSDGIDALRITNVPNAYEIHLMGTSGYSSIFSESNFALSAASGQPVTIQANSAALTLSTDTSGHIVLSPAGNLGIGTTNPGSKATILGGDVYVASSGSGIILKDTADGTCRRVVLTSGSLSVSGAIACPSS